MGKHGSRVAPSSSHSSGSISTFESTGGGTVGIATYQSMSALLYLGEPTTCRSLGVECFRPSLDIYGDLCVSCSCISSPSSVQVSGIIYQQSIQTTYSTGTLLDGGSLASHSFQHAGRHSSPMSYLKISWMFQ